MWKRRIALFSTCVMLMASSMSVFAAPKVMPDGQTFDPEYYAATYPDVVAVLGTDEAALYNHYVQYGKAEGRNPVAPGTNAVAETSSVKAPKCAQDMVNALNSLDYDKIKSYATNYTNYLDDLAPYLWEQKGDKVYYYVPCEGGNLTLCADTYGGELWLLMGIGKQDVKTSQEKSQRDYEADIRFYSSKMNYNQEELDYLKENGAWIYPKECFMKGDTWIRYTVATNGYKDYQIYADGKVVYGDTDWICPTAQYF